MKNSVKLILLPAMLAFAFACKKSDNAPPPATVIAATATELTVSVPQRAGTGSVTVVTTFAGSGNAGIVVDKYGTLYVADAYNNRIRKIVLE